MLEDQQTNDQIGNSTIEQGGQDDRRVDTEQRHDYSGHEHDKDTDHYQKKG